MSIKQLWPTVLKPNFQSAEFSERAEFSTIKSCSAVTIYSISEQYFLPQTIGFPPARKIPLTGNHPLGKVIMMQITPATRLVGFDACIS